MVPLNVCAQETPDKDDDIEARLLSMKNPFKSRLPKTEKELKEERERAREIERQDKIRAENEALGLTNDLTSEEFAPTETSFQSSEHPDHPEPPEPIEVEEIVPLPNVKISGVIWDSDRPQAIINGRIVNIGDNILGIQITEISKTAIDGIFHERAVTIQIQRSQL